MFRNRPLRPSGPLMADGANSHNSPAGCTIDSKKLEYRPRTIYAGFAFCLGFGVGGQSYSNFLASTVAYH